MDAEKSTPGDRRQFRLFQNSATSPFPGNIPSLNHQIKNPPYFGGCSNGPRANYNASLIENTRPQRHNSFYCSHHQLHKVASMNNWGQQTFDSLPSNGALRHPLLQANPWHPFGESTNSAFQQRHALFGNIRNPFPVGFPSRSYENMQVCNSSMQLQLDNGLPPLPDTKNGLPQLPEAGNGLPPLPEVVNVQDPFPVGFLYDNMQVCNSNMQLVLDNGLSLLPDANNDLSPFPEADNSLPPLPEAGNGLPPLPEAGNGLPPLPEAVNVQDPFPVGFLHDNMQVCNSSMQLVLDNGFSPLLEAENGLPQLPKADNGLPPLPEAGNGLPPLPEAGNGFPPLPEAGNGLPPLPEAVNVQDPFPVGFLYDKMQVCNSSMQLVLDNGLLPLPDAINGLSPLPEAENGLPQLPKADNGLPPLPGAYNGWPPLPGADNGLPPLPGANNGLPPLPEADNGLPQLPSAVMMSSMPSQSIISESPQTGECIPRPNQQLYKPSDCQPRYSSIDHGWFSMPNLYANATSHEKTDTMKEDFDAHSSDNMQVCNSSMQLVLDNGLPPLPDANNGLPPLPDANNGLPPLPDANNGLSPLPEAENGLPPLPKADNGLPPPPGAYNGLPPLPGADNGLPPLPGADSSLPQLPSAVSTSSLDSLVPSQSIISESPQTGECIPQLNQRLYKPSDWEPRYSSIEEHGSFSTPNLYANATSHEKTDTMKGDFGAHSSDILTSTSDDLVVDPKLEKDAYPVLNFRAERNLKKLKKTGVSSVEWFTTEQIKEHLYGLMQWANQSVVRKRSGNEEMRALQEYSCQLCGVCKLLFSPPPIYCSSCGFCIKASAIYYSSEEKKSAHLLFCNSCYKNSRGGNITFSGTRISKAKLLKKRNNDETQEMWVRCGYCGGWQHQICGLYNVKRDSEGNAEYVCPKCLLEGNQTIIMDLKPNMAFGAKELPSTALSNYIEQRLFRRLQQEREETATAIGKTLDEVPEPEDLVVRVVLSVDRCLKVKKQFIDIFHEKNYPSEFPFRSKVILLFQKIEGADVCLFGLRVQEFGSECDQPDQRSIYISYLDSVKYFRPERTTSTGEALRTFVYHEILIGYLEYCKKRGFATCYLWACPPAKGEDYILNCHPETQKTPRSDKLRRWYQSMLKKAAENGIVLNVTNLYDQFFDPMNQSMQKVTAARLPQFDGDYWSSVADNVIQDIDREGKDVIQKKVKLMTSRKLKALGYKHPTAHAAKDILLMQKLGQTILPYKQDFMVVQLQFSCISCCQVILSRWRWSCSLCKNFQLCERCHKNTGEDYHYVDKKEKHPILKVVNDISCTTEDGDITVENALIESRHGFLEFCRRNHYQFDMLRRAKHSSMMILYHLHNPNEEMMSEKSSCKQEVICNICNKDITTELYHRCLLCKDFSICTTCRENKHALSNVHALPTNPSAHGTQSEDAADKIDMYNERLNDVRHAFTCRATGRDDDPCSNPRCSILKQLFKHDLKCKIRGDGGCTLCVKATLLLAFHANHCQQPNCSVRRCRRLKSSKY